MFWVTERCKMLVKKKDYSSPHHESTRQTSHMLTVSIKPQNEPRIASELAQIFIFSSSDLTCQAIVPLQSDDLNPCGTYLPKKG